MVRSDVTQDRTRANRPDGADGPSPVTVDFERCPDETSSIATDPKASTQLRIDIAVIERIKA